MSRSVAGRMSLETRQSCQCSAHPPVCRETGEDLQRNAAEHKTETTFVAGPEFQF